MNDDVKVKWVNALESGEYEQGFHALKTWDFNTETHTYCCLGVLCDLYMREVGGKWAGEQFIDTENGSSSIQLPRGVMEWAGLDDPEGIMNVKEGRLVELVGKRFDELNVVNVSKLNLVNLNDSRIPFKDIALVIREEL